ncbi:MAG: mechanosensitive ion channel, partial [Spirochaetales bacterium]|nr:mechanosensitive ion channel [Spirochaetales bacterium]
MSLESILAKLEELAVTYGLNIVMAHLIFFLGWWVVKAITGGIKKLMLKKSVDKTVTGFFSKLIYIGLLMFVIIAALGRLGIQTASLVAILGAAGLAVGLALQGSLSNFAAGVLIIMLKPFNVGDYIEAAGTSGSVEEIGMFMTTLKTPDNRKVVSPNTHIMGGNIVNYTSREVRRLDLIMGVSYDDDIHKVEKLLKEILDNHELALKDPAYLVGILEFADSSINFA